MPRGGARVNSGPPPDPDALRRDRKEDRAGWTILPAAGRQGDAPEWPLPPEARLSAMLELVESQREMLEAQIEAADATPRGAMAKLSRLDQKIAEVKYRLDRVAALELEIWETLWHTPQAVAWEALRWTREVAVYTRWQSLGELGDLDAAKEARQWSDRLGLNSTALLRNRWKIDGAVPAAAPAPPAPRRRRTGAKDRLKVIEGGAGGKT